VTSEDEGDVTREALYRAARATRVAIVTAKGSTPMSDSPIHRSSNHSYRSLVTLGRSISLRQLHAYMEHIML
jgi:hypothetical protein